MGPFTIERVAALAGASKMTVYKWWPSRNALALEAYAQGVSTAFAVPDTGDIEADLRTHLRGFVDVLRDTRAGQVMAELVGAAQTDPELAAGFRRVYLEPRRRVGVAALTAAQERDQIRGDVDLEAVSDQLWGACVYRLMSGLHPLDHDFVDALLDTVLTGIRP